MYIIEINYTFLMFFKLQIPHIVTSRTMIFMEIPWKRIPRRQDLTTDFQITRTTRPMSILSVSWSPMIHSGSSTIASQSQAALPPDPCSRRCLTSDSSLSTAQNKAGLICWTDFRCVGVCGGVWEHGARWWCCGRVGCWAAMWCRGGGV